MKIKDTRNNLRTVSYPKKKKKKMKIKESELVFLFPNIIVIHAITKNLIHQLKWNVIRENKQQHKCAYTKTI